MALCDGYVNQVCVCVLQGLQYWSQVFCERAEREFSWKSYPFGSSFPQLFFFLDDLLLDAHAGV